MIEAIPEDPIIALIAERHRICNIINQGVTDEELDAFAPQRRALNAQLINAEPVNLTGVLAGLEEAKFEFEEYHGCPDNSSLIISSRIDAAISYLKERGDPMPSPAAEQKAIEIADKFLDAELDSDADAKAFLVDKITAALEEAEKAGYSKAMRKRF